MLLVNGYCSRLEATYHPSVTLVYMSVESAVHTSASQRSDPRQLTAVAVHQFSAGVALIGRRERLRKSVWPCRVVRVAKTRQANLDWIWSQPEA
jgi:hypothetical protein